MGLSDRYGKAQAMLGISRVLKEQARLIGFKSWTKMTDSEKIRLLDSLRKIWKEENKEGVDDDEKRT